MALQFFNTLTRRKEDFVPLDPRKSESLHVWSDGLQLRAHRQLPRVRL